MAENIQQLESKLNDLYQQLDGVLLELAAFRKTSPRAKAETARLLEGYLINVSKRIKQISRENQDDLLEGISLLKIKMMG